MVGATSAAATGDTWAGMGGVLGGPADQVWAAEVADLAAVVDLPWVVEAVVADRVDLPWAVEAVVADRVEGLAGREAAEVEARQVAGALVAEQVAEQVVVAEAAVAAKSTQRCRGTSDGRVTTRKVSVPDGAEPLIIQEGGEPARKDDTPAESQGTAPRKHRRPRRELAED